MAAPPQAPVIRMVGNVSLFNQDSNFVLISTQEVFAPGTKLRCISPDGQETAVVTVSQEKRRAFIIADVVSGTPVAGDHVAP